MTDAAGRLNRHQTLVAWLAALLYLGAAIYAHGTTLAWWRGSLAELALLAGLGGFLLLWILLPLGRLASTGPGASALVTRMLAVCAAIVSATGAALVGVDLVVRHYRDPAAFTWPLGSEAPFDSAVYWLLSLGLLGPWLLQVNLGAWRSHAWPRAGAAAGLLAGAALLLAPVAFLDLPFGANELSVLVSVAVGRRSG